MAGYYENTKEDNTLHFILMNSTGTNYFMLKNHPYIN